MAVLELDRVLELSPGNVNNRRLSLERFKDEYRDGVLRSSSELLTRMDAAAFRADQHGLVHWKATPATVRAIDETKTSIVELVETMGVNLALDAIQGTDWKEALKSKEHLKAAGKEIGKAAAAGLGTAAALTVAIIASKDKMEDLFGDSDSSA